MPNTWIEALKKWNAEKGGPWCVPKKGSPEMEAVKKFYPPSVPKKGKVAKVPIIVKSKKVMEAQTKANRDKALSQLRQVERDTQERNLQRRNESRNMKSIEQLRQVERDTKARNEARKVVPTPSVPVRRTKPKPKLASVPVPVPSDEIIEPTPIAVPESKYTKAYRDYVTNYDTRKKEADEYRQSIQGVAKRDGIMNPLARFMASAVISFPVDEEPKLTMDEWVERTKAQEAYLASAPERYIKALDREEARNLKVFEKQQEPIDTEGIITNIPSKKTELVAIIKENEIKGFSGKGVAELQALIETYNEKILTGRQNAKTYLTKESIENFNAIGAFRVLMGLEKSKLEKLNRYFNERREAEGERLQKERASIPRRVTKDDVPRVNDLIAKINAKTKAFNDKYREMGGMIRGAIDFKETNKYRALEQFVSVNAGSGIPEPIEVYLKEANL